MRSTRSSLSLLSPIQLTRVLLLFWAAQSPIWTPICGSRKMKKCGCYVRWWKWNKLLFKNHWNGWRGIFRGYPQQDHRLHHRHCVVRTYALTWQLRSVDAARSHGIVRHFQEDNIQPARPDRNSVLRIQGTPRSFWNHWYLIHTTSGSQHCLRKNP